MVIVGQELFIVTCEIELGLNNNILQGVYVADQVKPGELLEHPTGQSAAKPLYREERSTTIESYS